MPISILSDVFMQANLLWISQSQACKVLMVYGGLMCLAFFLTFWVSQSDARTLREVGVWIKPMKFMAATALFAWTTVVLVLSVQPNVAQREGFDATFNWIAGLIIATSLFEVVYITYQGAQGQPSHYNNSDALHTLLFGLMGIAAVGLTFSQFWLAWEIWKTQGAQEITVLTWGVLLGLVLTFVLGTVSGFLLGAHQPPAGQGLPFVGWHLHRDIRPAHFLGVHAQQIIPIAGLLAEKFAGGNAAMTLTAVTGVYVSAWLGLIAWALN